MKLYDPPDQNDAARCANCGYDLRAVRSDKCPECGAVHWIALAKLESKEELDEAVAALDNDGLAFNSVVATSNSPLLSQTLWMGGGPIDKAGGGVVFVKRSEFNRAAAVLIVHFGEPPRTIVDRAEPICPACHAALDPSGPDSCANCGKLFDWVEIEPAQMESMCLECRYDLTGNTSELCPECGAAGPRDPHPMDDPHEAQHQHPLDRLSPYAAIIITILPLIMLAIILLAVGKDEALPVAAMAAGLAIIIAAVMAIRVLTRTPRR
jgi:hypothetical protein